MRRIKAMAILAVLAMCGAAQAASISGEVTVIPERYACMTVTDVEPTTISEADGIALAQELAKQNSVAQAQIVFYKPGTKVGDGIAAVAWTFGDEKIFRLSKDADLGASMVKEIGCDIQQTLPADQGLRSAQRLFRTEILAIQVAFLKDVRIAQAKASCAHTGQQACYMSAKPSASGYEYAEGKQTRHLARGKHSPVATKALRPDILLQQDNHGVFKRDAEKLGQSGDTLAADVKAVVIPIFRIWFQQAVQFMLVKGT